MHRLALFGLLALLSQASSAAYRFDVPDYLARLPEQTYYIVENSFNTLYQQTDFTPQITNSYFNNSHLIQICRGTTSHQHPVWFPAGGIWPNL